MANKTIAMTIVLTEEQEQTLTRIQKRAGTKDLAETLHMSLLLAEKVCNVFERNDRLCVVSMEGNTISTWRCFPQLKRW